MEAPDLQIFEPERPRTATVISLLVGAALILSYLAAYAVTNALVAADVISPWPVAIAIRGRRWMGVGFFTLITMFTIIGGIMRLLSRRQLHEIDEMESDDLVL